MYITVEELGLPEETLIRLTDDEGSGMADTARAGDAISAAQAQVDAALRTHHDPPVAEPSGLVKALTRDIAVYRLYLRTGPVPEQVVRAYEAAAGILEKVSMGLFHLGLDRTGPGPGFSYDEREFTRKYMEGF